MYYIVYKTTNTLNGRFYIGSHATKKLEDGYLGSGVSLKEAIRKYGRKVFERQILANCVSLAVARQVEGSLVSYNLDTYGRMCYNRSRSGTGSVSGEGNHFYGKTHTSETKIKISEAHKGKYTGTANPFYGKKHSAATKEKRQHTLSLRGATETEILYRFRKSKVWYCTPYVCGISDRDLEEILDISRCAIRNRCKNPEKFVTNNYQVPEKYWGRTWKENDYYTIDRYSSEV